MSSFVLFFQTFSEMFPVAAHWIHGSCLEAGNTCQHVWRTPLEALSAPTLAWPLRRPVNTSGPSRQVRHAAGGTAGSSLTSRSEALQQHFYWRDNYKKVQTEQIQTYWNMWGNNWLHCCWLVEASDWQMVLPITNHLYYLILRLLVDDRGINRVIKYWWRQYLATCERDSTISCCCSWIAFCTFKFQIFILWKLGLKKKSAFLISHLHHVLIGGWK